MWIIPEPWIIKVFKGLPSRDVPEGVDNCTIDDQVGINWAILHLFLEVFKELVNLNVKTLFHSLPPKSKISQMTHWKFSLLSPLIPRRTNDPWKYNIRRHFLLADLNKRGVQDIVKDTEQENYSPGNEPSCLPSPPGLSTWKGEASPLPRESSCLNSSTICSRFDMRTILLLDIWKPRISPYFALISWFR